MFTVICELSRRGFSVDVVLAQKEGPFLDHLPAGTRCIDLNVARMSYGIPALARYLRARRPDVVLSALANANLAVILANGIARTGARLVISEHINVSREVGHSRGWRARCVRGLIRMLYPRADSIVSVSDGVRDDILAILGNRSVPIRTIYNPVVSDEVLEASQESIDHPWFTRKTHPVIVAAGRLVPQKDFATLLRSFSIVRKSRKARLVILGEGELRCDLESLVDDLGLTQDVHMPGYVTNPYKYMRHADVFVLSSIFEGFGNVVAEALACDSRVVSTDCRSGPREILDNGRFGKLVQVQDADGMATAILNTIQEPVAQSRDFDGHQFSVERSIEQYIEVLFGCDQRRAIEK